MFAVLRTQVMPRPEVNKWLDKVFKVLLAVAKKGGLTVNEQLVRAFGGARHAANCMSYVVVWVWK